MSQQRLQAVEDKATDQNFRDLARRLRLAEALIPSGTLLATARATSPTGYLLCDGAAISRTKYATLFDAIGTKFGTGDGSTTFNVPDLRGRVPVGVDGAAARLAEKDALGEASGAETVTLITEQIPSHRHQQIARFGGAGAVNGLTLNTLNNAVFGSDQTEATGGGKSHTNMQPYQIVNYVIKT